MKFFGTEVVVGWNVFWCGENEWSFFGLGVV